MTDRMQTAAIEGSKNDDRRFTTRTGLQLQADVTLPGELTIIAHTLDISLGGISLQVPYRLELGQECVIELDLSALGGPSWARLTAEVRHCAPADGCFRAGLQFRSVDPTLAELLDGLL